MTRLQKFIARLFSTHFLILAGTLTVTAADDQKAALTMQGGGAGTPNAPSTVMVSLQPNGSQFGDDTWWPAMSDDGRYVAFAGDAAYRHDLITGETEVVSVDREGNAVPVMPSLIAMSADGRYVFYAFLSIDSPPPIPDGPSGYYMRDMDTGETELIEMPTTDGEPPDAWPHNGKFDVSADGRTIAFVSLAENLVQGKCDENPIVEKCAYVFDRDANIVERVSVAYDGGPLTDGGTPWDVVISADGRYVAFISGATNHVPDDTNEYHDVFVYDRVTKVTERVSVGFDGSEGNHYSGVFSPPVISSDGRYVAFSSQATNLVPEDMNGLYSDVFVHDRHAGTIELISVSSDGTQGNRPAYPSGISADGRFIVFSSDATNLVSDDTNDAWDSFIHDRDASVTERVSAATDGSQGDGNSDSRVDGVSASGRFIAFSSSATNLVSDDTNDKVDVFVRDRAAHPGDAELIFDPESLDFGEVEMGASSPPRKATLSNIGDADANGLAFGLNGDSGFGADTSACGTTLPVDESCEISVTFTPATPAPAGATLQVDSDEGPTVTAQLLGSGVGSGGPGGPSWIPQAKLLASDGGARHNFGQAVALSGDTALISDGVRTMSPIELSKVHEFIRGDETWSEQAILEPDDAPLACVLRPNGTFVCPFYGRSIAMDGDLAVVGAPWDFRNSRDVAPPGRAFVFEKDNGQWTPQAVLTASDGIGYDQFGYSVDVSGDTILVGARRAAGDFALGDGAAYVFVRDGNDWVEQARLQPVDDDDWPHPWNCTAGFQPPCPEFGYAVALEGDTAVVGAYNLHVGESSHHGDRERQGAAYVFTREQGTWNQQTRLNPDYVDCRDQDNYPEDTASCGFGSAVSLSGDSLLVSAGGARVGEIPLAGAAYVFVHEDGAWNEQAKLTPPEDDFNPGDLLAGFGFDTNAVLDGDTVLMGSQLMRSNGPDSDAGTAYLYKHEGENWSEPLKLTTPLQDNQTQSYFSYSVALSGTTALVGAPGYDLDNEGGAAYIFIDSDATLTFAPADIDFGTVEVGQSVNSQATLRNLGDDTLTGLTFPSDLGNGLVAATADDGCAGSLPAGQSCVFVVAFGPEASGPVSATLHVESNEGPVADLHLSGNGGNGAPSSDSIFEDRFK